MPKLRIEILLNAFITVALILSAFLPTLPAQAAPARADSTLPASGLGSYLAPDGSLNLPPGFSGSLNPAGFQMEFDPGGAPRFVPNAPAAPDAAITMPGAENWSNTFSADGTNGQVNALLAIGTNLYVAGIFRTAGGVIVYNVACWDGTIWSAVGGGLDGEVHALATDGSGNLYAGGLFLNAYTDPINNITVPANHIAKWRDGDTSWSEVGYGFAGIGGTVYALAYNSGILFAGGAFTAAYADNTHTTTVPTNLVASWNGTAWSEVGFGLYGNDAAGREVRSLAVDGTTLYAGGAFIGPYNESHTLYSSIAKNIAVWNGSQWTEAGYGFTNGTVYALAVDANHNLYAGGSFHLAYTDSGHTTPTLTWNIARWTGSGAWSQLIYGLDSDVRSLAFDGSGNLYAGGEFACFYNSSSECSGNAYNIVKFASGGTDVTAWSEVGYGLANGFVYALAVMGSGTVYAGGDFEGYSTDAARTSSVYARNIASWNGATWARLGSGAGISDLTSERVLALAIDNSGSVYAGGQFTCAGGVPVNNIARWNGTSWSEVGFGLDGAVQALVFDNSGNLYAAGRFNNAYLSAAHTVLESLPINYVARWNGTAWSEVGFGVNWWPTSLAWYAGKLIVGGSFTEAYTDSGYVNSVPANGVAQWSGSGALSEVGFGIFGDVRALATDGTTLYAGGSFTEAYTSSAHTVSTPAKSVASWNGSGAWAEVGYGLSGSVNALAVSGSKLYAGGDFWFGCSDSDCTPFFLDNFAIWNGATWSGEGLGIMNATVKSLVVTSGGDLFAGGNFMDLAGNIAQFDGTTWNPLAGGLDGVVNTMAAFGGYLYAGGMFDTAGSPAKVSSSIARWTAPERRAVSGNGSQTFYSDTYPVTINVTTRGDLASLVVQRHDSSHPSDPVGDGYYWQIEGYTAGGGTASGFTVNLTFTAPAGYTPGSRSAICKFVNPGWACDVSSHTGSTITLNGITSLSEWALGETSTTAADLASYRAIPRAGGLELAWQTLTEANTAGFNLYRRPLGGGSFTRLNPELIPAQAPGEAQGSPYRYLDGSALPGLRYEYRLESVAADQSTRIYGLEIGYYLLNLPLIR